MTRDTAVGLIENEPGSDWRDLQRRVAAVLEESGLKTEIGRKLAIARGNAEIDVYATDPTATPTAVYLCECKRWSVAVPQGEVQSFKAIVSDAGAHFGLFISAHGFQSGAYEVVEHTNVHLLSWTQFQAMFAERWCREYWVPMLRHGAGRLADYVDPVSSDAWMRETNGKPMEPEEAAGFMVHEMWGPPFAQWGGRPEPLMPAIWALRDRFRPYLPPEVRDAKYLRDLLNALLVFSDAWMKRTGRR